ncbi:DUF885 family protein [uncultured Lacinutrix sp.]|uniref:DUF885 domain-containing protein n=1 Tax=uncultured Lacinutrix sp. TaxID=574032 RepID=UPI00261833F2|nr:DUF885 domain-containing protein [uncultured Lacinutrix sp.]
MKFSKLLFFFIGLLFINSCKKESKSEVSNSDLIAIESKKLNDVFQKTFEEDVAESPMMQTRLGQKTKDYGKWDDYSDANAQKELEKSKKRLAFLKDSVDTSLLNESTLLSYKLAKQNLENNISDFKYRFHNYPLNQMHGAQAEIPAFLINMHSISNTSDAEAYISRLNNMKLLFATIEEQLNTRKEKGILPPKFVFEKIIDDSKNIITGLPFDNSKEESTLLNDFKTKVNTLDISDIEKNDLIKTASTALLNNVKPAFSSLISLLETHQKDATTEDGVWKFPNGEAFYNNALQRTTTTTMTANEIHELGLNEVKRIHDEMRVIMNTVNFKGDLQDFFKFMREDKQFYYPETNEGKAAYLKDAVALIDTMKSKLDELFITRPKADIEVKAVEAFREKSAGKAFYQRGTPDGSRPGRYYANLYDMKSMPSYQMEALAYHEGIPGHHMQLSIAQELEDVPMFRKLGGYTAYIEGWGLYNEYLPKEVGMYSDPYSDFGRLAMELWRACRLVVDTGIHAKKWTREEGINYYTTNTPNAKNDAVKMVERHIVMASQATAYKIGMNKILALREQAKKSLGNKFDIREFHDVVLTNGPVPLTILEELVNKWVASKS